MATSYPLTYSCYYGGTEAADIGNDYMASAQSPKSLLLNVFSSMGLLYDTVYYLLDWQGQNRIDL
jgi:hypothetical protein